MSPIYLHTYSISSEGEIMYDNTGAPITKIHHSTNGYDYVPLMVEPRLRAIDPINHPNAVMLFRIDLIIAHTFMRLPEALFYTHVALEHINGDTHDCRTENMRWIEYKPIWKPVMNPDVHRYEVNDQGLIRNAETHEIIKPEIVDNIPYVTLRLLRHDSNGVNVKKFRVDSIVANAFFGERPKNMMLHHINEISLCCRVDALEYIPMEDYRECKCTRIIRHVTPEDMDTIRDLLIKHNGSIKEVYDALDKDVYPHITYGVINGIKSKVPSYLKSVKYSAEDIKQMEFKSLRPVVTVETSDTVRLLLMKYKGDVKLVTEDPKCTTSLTTVRKIKDNKDYSKSNLFDLSKNGGKYPYEIDPMRIDNFMISAQRNNEG